MPEQIKSMPEAQRLQEMILDVALALTDLRAAIMAMGSHANPEANAHIQKSFERISHMLDLARALNSDG
jgi:hypothetical protein